MTRSLVLGVALALGCGGRSVNYESNDDDGSNRGGTSAGAATSGGTTSGGAGGWGGASTSGSGGEECRLYASRFTQNDQQEVSECAFDRASVTLACKTQRFDLETTTWPSLDAFLANNRPVGHFTFVERRFVSEGDCDYTQTVTRDGAGRPETHTAVPHSRDDYGCGDDTFTYLEWDAEGRPKTALLDAVSSISSPPDLLCTQQAVTYDYDDANGRYVEHRRGGSGLSCTNYSTTWSFDPDGLLVSEAYDFGDETPTIRSYMTLETDRVCRD